MSKIASLKAQATNLKLALEAVGVKLTHAQALEAIAKQYGFENWDTIAGILNKTGTLESETVALTIPAVVKSVKGCQMLLVTSHDGAAYDRQVIVPSHLDVDVIAAKLADEIVRLKALDREFEELLLPYDEYTEEDLSRFIGALGCVWVTRPKVVRETWD